MSLRDLYTIIPIMSLRIFPTILPNSTKDALGLLYPLLRGIFLYLNANYATKDTFVPLYPLFHK